MCASVQMAKCLSTMGLASVYLITHCLALLTLPEPVPTEGVRRVSGSVGTSSVLLRYGASLWLD